MMTFDAPERTRCTVKRQATSTPLQALVLLNDPQFLEASRATACRILKDHGGKDEQIAHVFRLITGRNASEREQALMTKYYQSQFDKFNTDKSRARQLLEVGEFPYDKSIDAAEAAAFTLLISSIFNLDAAVTKS